ncbi:MAG TPA: N-acetyl-1-D-myo-inositol-2-amino-2-deoxy-alpha-D-glucopyranoside deacetylase [Jiangellaceae bacterium]|nr:N-acetyl-1-D-myo-inositol-2-amino-2-deoxy-alpha-D-glucopyranoside deacetylase [Jiangellaceae bacterium]
MADVQPGRRLLLVHAHPDDETIANGATMARYASEGALVTLVTCTLGEEGEVLVPDLEHLAAHRDDGLGQHRIGELAAAMAELGVTDHRFLGGPGRYRDTGMGWTETGLATAPADVRADAFWLADMREAADHLVEIIREVRPQVLITYDDFGGYGHPDHVQAHRVATYASALAAVPSYRLDLGRSWDVPKIYWTAFPRSVVEQAVARSREAGSSFFGIESADDFGIVVPDDAIAAAIDGTDHFDRKMAAMKAHATQITQDGPFFALPEEAGRLIWGWEYYRLAKGLVGPVDADGDRESDLFAGVAAP